MDAPYAWVYLGAMNARLIALVLVLAAQPTAADRGTTRSFVDGHRLVSFCISQDGQDASFCAGYLQAAKDAVSLAPVALGHALECSPRGMSYDQLRAAFLAWADSNRKELRRAAAAVTRQAFSDLWPCQERAS
jgi:hypothetical protein